MKRNRKDIYLPNDVVNEILLRLPTKSLGRCKSVCKIWYNLIQNPVFVKNQFHHPQNPTRLFAFTSAYAYKTNDYELAWFKDEYFLGRQHIRNPLHRRYIEHIPDPVEGLYFMSYFPHRTVEREYHYALWNPSTSEIREIPLPYPQSEGYQNSDACIGFGSTNEDIKVIYFKRSDTSQVVSLYSLAHDSWKVISNHPYDLIDVYILDEYTATHLNGACYWTGVISLLIFDMTNEVFRVVKLPPQDAYGKLLQGVWVRDNSSLVLFVSHYSSQYLDDRIKIDLWEMKAEGYWIKFFSFDPSSTYVSNPYFSFYGFWKENMIFIDGSNRAVCLYNIYTNENREVKTLGLDKYGKYFKVVLFNYKESLTSVRG